MPPQGESQQWGQQQMAGSRTRREKEVVAIAFNQKEQRVLEKSLATISLEATYSLKLLDLHNRTVKVHFRQMKDKVSRIKSHLEPDEIHELSRLEAEGKLQPMYPAVSLGSALKIAAAARRLHSSHRAGGPRGPPRAKSAIPRVSLPDSSRGPAGPPPPGVLKRSNSVTGVFIDAPPPHTEGRPGSARVAAGSTPSSSRPSTVGSATGKGVDGHPTRPDNMTVRVVNGHSTRSENMTVRVVNGHPTRSDNPSTGRGVNGHPTRSDNPNTGRGVNGHLTQTDNPALSTGVRSVNVHPTRSDNPAVRGVNGHSTRTDNMTVRGVNGNSIRTDNPAVTEPKMDISKGRAGSGGSGRPSSRGISRLTPSQLHNGTSSLSSMDSSHQHWKGSVSPSPSKLQVDSQPYRRSSSVLTVNGHREGTARSRKTSAATSHSKATTAHSHAPFSSHVATEKEAREREENGREGGGGAMVTPRSQAISAERTPSFLGVQDDLVDDLGEDLFAERRAELLEEEQYRAAAIARRKVRFLQDIDQYLKEHPTLSPASATTARPAPAKSSGQDKGQDGADVFNSGVFRRRRVEFSTSPTYLPEQDYRERLMGLWRDMSKCRYLRVPDDMIDLSGINTLASDTMRLFQVLKHREVQPLSNAWAE
ncbi:hypothetical protein ACOMHN_037079 [Nucella lapillus]